MKTIIYGIGWLIEKMRLLVQACSLLNARRLWEIGANGIIVGTSEFASRLPGDVTVEEMKALVEEGVPVIACVNNLFDESQLPALERYLQQLADIRVKELIFHDYAVAYICEEKNLPFDLVYNSETMVTSYGQLPFFEKNSVRRVALARELMLPEVTQIAEKNPTKVQIEVQIHGLMFVMQSKWNLLLNYKAYLEDKDLDISQEAHFMIREDTRKMGNFIYEDRNGTHMFTGYELCALELLPALFKSKVDCIRIDSAMREAEWIEKTAEVYVQALRLVKSGTLDEPTIKKLRQELVDIAGNVPLYQGFYGGPKTNPHFERTE